MNAWVNSTIMQNFSIQKKKKPYNMRITLQ